MLEVGNSRPVDPSGAASGDVGCTCGDGTGFRCQRKATSVPAEEWHGTRQGGEHDMRAMDRSLRKTNVVPRLNVTAAQGEDVTTRPRLGAGTSHRITSETEARNSCVEW